MNGRHSSPPFILIGNPENRRVSGFQQALAARGLPPATVLAWRDVIADPALLEALPADPARIRLDAVGEDAGVERQLLALGYQDALALGSDSISPARLATLPVRRGQILCPRQAHLGFVRVLDALSAVFASRPRWRVLNPPEVVAELFDKRITQRRFAALGLPVPEILQVVDPPCYIKLSCGSSASCLGLLELRGGRRVLTTTIEQAPREGAWFNTLKVRRISDDARIEEILGWLRREGAQIERSVPKARLGGKQFDCRVLTVAGEPAFTVIRQSPWPITNLHLGGTRGDPAQLSASCPPALMAQALESCRAVAATYPDALHIGIDLMFEAGWAGHRILEANAFGDLLPNLTRDGLSVYEWEIASLMS